MNTSKQYGSFLLVGLINAAVDIGVFNLLSALFPTRSALWMAFYNSAAVALAIVSSYLFNSRWTFRREIRHTLREKVLFAGQGLINVLVSDGIILDGTIWLNHNWSGNVWVAQNLLKVAAMVIASNTSFFLIKTLIFARKKV